MEKSIVYLLDISLWSWFSCINFMFFIALVIIVFCFIFVINI